MTAKKGPARPPSKRTLARRQEQHIKLLDAYLAGKNFPEMARELGYANKSNAFRALKSALDQRVKERAELADYVLEMILGRYDKLLETHMQIATDQSKPLDAARSAAIVLQTCDRMIKQFGLDQPQQHTVTVTTVDAVDQEIAEMAKALRDKAVDDGVDLELPIIEALINRGTAQ